MTIYELWLSGKFEPALEKGLLNQVKLYCEINQSFLKCRANRVRYRDAISQTAEAMCTSTATVRRAIAFVAK
jgi:hypothetical protein